MPNYRELKEHFKGISNQNLKRPIVVWDPICDRKLSGLTTMIAKTAKEKYNLINLGDIPDDYLIIVVDVIDNDMYFPLKHTTTNSVDNKKAWKNNYVANPFVSPEFLAALENNEEDFILAEMKRLNTPSEAREDSLTMLDSPSEDLDKTSTMTIKKPDNPVFVSPVKTHKGQALFENVVEI